MILFWLTLVLAVAAAVAAALAHRWACRARADRKATLQLLKEARALVRQTAVHRIIRQHAREN